MKAAPEVLPPSTLAIFEISYMKATQPPQHIKEYDPEWAKAFNTGSVGASCDHAQMLSKVKCAVLFTHHFSKVDEKTGNLFGASAVRQVDQVERLVKNTGQQFTRLSFPEMGHSMHGQDPSLFVRTLVDWSTTLPSVEDTRRNSVFASR